MLPAGGTIQIIHVLKLLLDHCLNIQWCNFDTNDRSLDVFASDDTNRVKLEKIDNDDLSDYINASYVKAGFIIHVHITVSILLHIRT